MNTASYIKPALFVSLGLNLFLLGMSIPHQMHFYGGHFPPPPPPMFEPLLNTANELPPESQARVVPLITNSEKKMDENFNQMGNNMNNLRKVLTSANVSTSDVDAAFETLRKHDNKISSTMMELTKGILLALPDQKERIYFFEHALPPEIPTPPEFQK